MRDGIFRDPALSAPWRDFGNACNSDADWDKGGPIHARRALRRDVREEVDPSVLRRFVEATRKRQPGLFESAFDIWSQCTGDRAPSVLEGQIRAHCDRWAEGKTPTELCLRRGIMDALRERCAARQRDLRSDLQRQRATTVAKIERRAEEILENLPTEDFVDALCRGEMPSQPSLAGDGLDAEEDLS